MLVSAVMTSKIAVLTVAAGFAGSAITFGLAQAVGIAGAQDTPLPPAYVELTKPATPTKGPNAADKVKLSQQKALVKSLLGPNPSEKEMLMVLTSYAIIANSRDKQHSQALSQLGTDVASIKRTLQTFMPPLGAAVEGLGAKVDGVSAKVDAVGETASILKKDCTLHSTAAGFTYSDGTMAGRVCNAEHSAERLEQDLLVSIYNNQTIRGLIIDTYDCVIRGFDCD